MPISFDTSRKHIVLDSTEETWSNIWSRWCDWHASNRQWPLALMLIGGDSLGGGLFIPPYYFLCNGWLVRPKEESHNLKLIGNGFVLGGGEPVTNTLGSYRINVNYTVPVQAQGIATSGSSGPSAGEVANAVRTILMQELLKIRETHEYLGLSESDVTISDTAINSDNINQSLIKTGDSVIMRRN